MAFTRLKPSSRRESARHTWKSVPIRPICQFLAILILIAPGPSPGQQASDKDIRHLGAASCASSLCHGSVQPFEGSAILHNEFIIWQSDRYRNMHAKAFAKLRLPAAEAIAAKLDIGLAHEAPECLTCHADFVAETHRGERFQLSDGVTCESCHGAAGDYIDAHVKGDKSADELIALGLYPTWEPESRARLCLSCHLGGHGPFGQDRFINHRIMGAGHPRLSFELDTFTYLQPHHVVDDDYIQRKGAVDFVRDWAIGQGLAAIEQLDWLSDRERGWHGIFVEPALLDCHSCHRRLDANQWQPRASTGLGPGEMRLNDANLTILALVMITVDPEAAASISNGSSSLHRATTLGVEEVLEAASRLRSDAERAVGLLRNYAFRVEDLEKVLSEMNRRADSGAFRDFIAAEQAAMSIVNLVLAFERAGAVDKDTISQDLDRLYETVADQYAYSDRAFGAALQSLSDRINAASG